MNNPNNDNQFLLYCIQNFIGKTDKTKEQNEKKMEKSSFYFQLLMNHSIICYCTQSYKKQSSLSSISQVDNHKFCNSIRTIFKYISILGETMGGCVAKWQSTNFQSETFTVEGDFNIV